MQHTHVKSNHISGQKSSGSTIFAQPTGSLVLSSHEQSSQSEPTQLTVADTVVKMLEDLGVRHAFGVSGGAIASLWASLEHSVIEVLHFRHETGAGFAAIESYFANNRPVVVFTTTGPGITNMLTGLFAARWEGAKVIFLSPATSAPQRGRWAFQETSSYTMPSELFCNSGSLFHYATSIESGEELPEIARRLAAGLARPGGFVAHLSVPTTIQSSLLKASLPRVTFSQTLTTAGEDAIAKSVQLLSEGPFAIWVGFGARGAAEEIRQLAERTGSAVMSSPRGKGIFPENHPQYLGVTGFGGHNSVVKYMQDISPGRILVLGTRLGEFTSFWSPAMVPKKGFVHVDIDPEVPGTAYPSVETFSIQSDVQVFVKALLKYFPNRPGNCPVLPNPQRVPLLPQAEGPVRPDVLMDTIQRVFVEKSDAVVMTEAGNSFAWRTHTLRFTKPGRYRVSTGFGSMGHAATGILGAALVQNNKAVAILGDGAMLMNSEVSTAVKYQIPAVWIVLNDSRYNMCTQGMALLGFKGVDTQMSPVDFVAIARGMGADGIRVESETDLQAVLEKALASKIPFVVDVIIDPTQTAPFGSRIQSLIEQGAKETNK
ncbi:ScyA-related TPP-binding enzyme [Nostoc sp. CHAB 5784]|uniref:ScyA-related TPP-binding enzyme n=1 Tax=Nostoc mirabile TaxID=2907820 RepID=UPI001E3A1F36|nr:ScyA-related TPP-binding enzyme [Nostoc mirabile]MCC5670773.1 ScyA-related TPP-binding enzyme [Nostoc mirabile CHAB5784]